MSALRFVNARIACPSTGEREGELFVADGRIAGCADDAETIDLAGATLAPGIVDLGVFAVDGKAARFGGVTTLAVMPDAPRSAADGLTLLPLASATNGAELAEIGLARDAGAVAVTTGHQWIADSGLMHRALGYAAGLGLPMIVHAEDSGLAGDAVATDGETATRLGLPSAPAIAEAMAVARDIALAVETGARLHFRQVTTRVALDMIRAAKAEDLPVTCGITPAHLLLSDIAIGDYRTFARLSPPLRSEADRQACLAAVADGTIDVICSGHDPRGAEEKRLPFAESAPGSAGTETLLALALGLVRDGLIDRQRLFALLAANPSAILGAEGGTLEPGAPADLIVIDEGAPWVIDADRMQARAGNTPFDRLPVQGRVRQIYRQGLRLA